MGSLSVAGSAGHAWDCAFGGTTSGSASFTEKSTVKLKCSADQFLLDGNQRVLIPVQDKDVTRHGEIMSREPTTHIAQVCKMKIA